MTAQVGAALSAGNYVNWGVIHVSVTNLTIILVMIVVFVAALLVPFPHHEDAQPQEARVPQEHRGGPGERP